MITLLKHQIEALNETKQFNKCAYFYDMGLGKTYIGSEKAMSFNKNILVVCQKSKVEDWYEHFGNNYEDINVCNLTKVKDEDLKAFLDKGISYQCQSYARKLNVWIINYDLIWRRKELSNLKDYTLLLDESSLIQNETTKRSKFIIKKLQSSNVVLLSGTPCNGKYEQLWSQCHLLGWEISKDLFYRQYVVIELSNEGYPIIVGYKNVDRLKAKLRNYGAVFKKTEEVIDLPKQNFITLKVAETKEFKKFKKDRIITIEDKQLVGDTTLTNLLYQRMLCGAYSNNKLEAFKDLLESTNDRLIVFYNFNEELIKLKSICEELNKDISIVNGNIKDLSNYENKQDSVCLVQYQAGAYGLNLQKANKVIYYTPPLSTELYEQSKKRIHRIGQDKACFYYLLKSGIDYHIYKVLEMRKDFTDELFKEILERSAI